MFIKIIVTIFLAVMFSMPCYADRQSRKAVVAEMEGDVKIKARNADWTGAQVGTQIVEGDIITTGPDSSAVINIEDGDESASLEMKEQAELRFAEFFNDTATGANTTLLDLALGEILVTSQKLRSESSKFEVKTPTSIVGVRGTTFSVAVEQEK